MTIWRIYITLGATIGCFQCLASFWQAPWVITFRLHVKYRSGVSEPEGLTADEAESGGDAGELPAADASDEEAETDVERRQSNRHASTRETGQSLAFCIGNF